MNKQRSAKKFAQEIRADRRKPDFAPPWKCSFEQAVRCLTDRSSPCLRRERSNTVADRSTVRLGFWPDEANEEQEFGRIASTDTAA
jgi:hypothetical protein